MVEALKARGIEVPYIVKTNEGHGFSNEKTASSFRAMEEFLANILGESEKAVDLIGRLIQSDPRSTRNNTNKEPANQR